MRVAGLAIVAAGFFLSKILLIALVSVSRPDGRYLAAAILLLPSALFAVLFELWRSILAGRRTQRIVVEG